MHPRFGKIKMKTGRYKYITVFIAGIAAVPAIICGCRKPYNPRPVKNPPRILVVEGNINPSSGSDLTVFRLTRTVPSGSSQTSPVLGALLTVEGDNNASYQLTEGNAGYYYYQGLNLDTTRRYRLHIKTTDAQDEYLSAYVPVKTTPPIDSIGFTLRNDGIQLYVNTHDPKNSTHYYRWDYEETWQFHSQFYSAFYSDGTGIIPRLPSQQIYYCYADSLSSDIVVGSSAKLSSDLIYQQPIKFIPSTSERIETKYSILVNQYALTSDAYNFWANLRKNTEQLGSIFDAQPSNINGNIYSVSKNSEPVVGYITACSVKSKRIYISNSQLPRLWLPVTPYHCELDTFLLRDRNGEDETRQLIPLPSVSLIVSQAEVNGLSIGFTAADRTCVDCTLRGFTSKPSFWQ